MDHFRNNSDRLSSFSSANADPLFNRADGGLGGVCTENPIAKDSHNERIPMQCTTENQLFRKR